MLIIHEICEKSPDHRFFEHLSPLHMRTRVYMYVPLTGSIYSKSPSVRYVKKSGDPVIFVLIQLILLGILHHQSLVIFGDTGDFSGDGFRARQIHHKFRFHPNPSLGYRRVARVPSLPTP